MSRIGKNPVTVPDGVSVDIIGALVTAKGKLGELSAQFTDDVEVTQEDNLVYVKPRNGTREARKMWGTSNSIISNLVVGVSQGFTRKLEINGVGYRAQVQGKTLNLQLGFSHDVNYPIPEGIEIKCADQTQIEIFGANKQRVGQVAAEIRAYRPPEPYKGKGIKYDDEYILRKEGKKK
jgi:large subunit ribosomal protein L6